MTVDDVRPAAVAALGDVFGLTFDELPADDGAGLWAAARPREAVAAAELEPERPARDGSGIAQPALTPDTQALGGVPSRGRRDATGSRQLDFVTMT